MRRREYQGVGDGSDGGEKMLQRVRDRIFLAYMRECETQHGGNFRGGVDYGVTGYHAVPGE